MKRVPIILLACILLPCLALAQAHDPLSPNVRKELNAFFSDIAASNMQSFDQGTLSDEDLLRFATWHCILHADRSLKRVNHGNDIVIPSAVIDKITETYLGKTVTKHLKPRYVESLASGEALVFAQVDSLRQTDDGTFQATGTIYYTGSGETLDTNASRARWKKAGIDVRVGGTFRGRLKRTTGDKPHWVLVHYDVKQAQ